MLCVLTNIAEMVGSTIVTGWEVWEAEVGQPPPQ